MILPFLKKMGGAFEHNFCPKRWKFEQTNLRKFPKEGVGGGGEGEGVGMLKLLIDQHNTVSFRKLCRR